MSSNPPESPADPRTVALAEYFAGQDIQRLSRGVSSTKYMAQAREILKFLSMVPVDMLIWCPSCLTQHIDAPEPGTAWTNPPHRSHTCHGCGKIFRVADFCTNGVAAIVTHGQRDTFTIGEPREDVLRERAASYQGSA